MAAILTGRKFTRTNNGKWVVVGPEDQMMIGVVPVHKANGETVDVNIDRLSRPWMLSGQTVRYGYIKGTRYEYGQGGYNQGREGGNDRNGNQDENRDNGQDGNQDGKSKTRAGRVPKGRNFFDGECVYCTEPVKRGEGFYEKDAETGEGVVACKDCHVEEEIVDNNDNNDNNGE